MTGWRLGYGVMPAPLAQRDRQAADRTPVSCTATFTQMAGVAALRGRRTRSTRWWPSSSGGATSIVDGLNRSPASGARGRRGAFYVFPNITGTGVSERRPSPTASSTRPASPCLSGTRLRRIRRGLPALQLREQPREHPGGAPAHQGLPVILRSPGRVGRRRIRRRRRGVESMRAPLTTATALLLLTGGGCGGGGNCSFQNLARIAVEVTVQCCGASAWNDVTMPPGRRRGRRRVSTWPRARLRPPTLGSPRSPARPVRGRVPAGERQPGAALHRVPRSGLSGRSQRPLQLPPGIYRVWVQAFTRSPEPLKGFLDVGVWGEQCGGTGF